MEIKKILGKLSKLKLKDIKRGCIVRGINFYLLQEFDVLEMQGWLIKHWDDLIIKSRIKTYDVWLEDNLELFGYIKEGEFPSDLKLAKIKTHKNYLPESLRESPEEIIHFKPKLGTPKEKVFKWIQIGYSTQEVIEFIKEGYPNISVGSIKVWASKARKQQKYKKDANSTL